jgi:hypothetical protein
MKHAFLALLLVSIGTSSTLAQKKQSDREFEGFHGPVKTVSVENVELKQSGGTAVEGDRKPHKMLTFDPDGNLVSDKAYDHNGQEFDVRTYSFIDGERVVKHDVLSKNVIRVTAGPRKQDKRPADPRYSAKIKHKYDSQGNQTEKAWLYSDGRPGLRYAYKREGNRSEEMVYRPDGSLSHGSKSKLDDKGNEVETTDVVPGYPPFPKTTYTYLEFDSQGNWIKRKQSRGDSTSITYRTITYH